MRVSIIVPTLNEEGNVHELAMRTAAVLSRRCDAYEIIFIDDHSSDSTLSALSRLTNNLPIRVYKKSGAKGKAQSLLEGFARARYDIIGFIDADLQYPPEAFEPMIDRIASGADLVLTKRILRRPWGFRNILSELFRRFFLDFLHNLELDVQSGQKMFKKYVLESMELNPTPWTFDLEFVLKARARQYVIRTVDIAFEDRMRGESKISIFKAALELGKNSVAWWIKTNYSKNFPISHERKTNPAD